MILYFIATFSMCMMYESSIIYFLKKIGNSISKGEELKTMTNLDPN